MIPFLRISSFKCSFFIFRGLSLTSLTRFSLKPEESVFLDDRPENCEAARALGIHAIEFHNLKQAAKELEKLGVK